MLITNKNHSKCTAMDKLQYIDAVLAYIECHLSDDLNPGNIAERYFVSRSQLYRDFYACGTDSNANRAFGVELYTIADEAELNEAVQKSIDSGVPVLTLGGRAEPEWCITTGYEKTDNEVKYFGRSYFDGDASEDELLYTKNNYTFANRWSGEWPEGFVKLYNKKCEPLPEKEALKNSLETCLKMFSPHEKMGYGAYDFMIKSLNENKYTNRENNSEYGGWDICMHFQILQDARRAAYRYLKESAELLSGENNARILDASSLYKEMFDTLSSVVPYEELNKRRSEPKCNFDTWFSPELRKEIVSALQRMVLLEKEVRVILRGALDDWNK